MRDIKTKLVAVVMGLCICMSLLPTMTVQAKTIKKNITIKGKSEVTIDIANLYGSKIKKVSFSNSNFYGGLRSSGKKLLIVAKYNKNKTCTVTVTLKNGNKVKFKVTGKHVHKWKVATLVEETHYSTCSKKIESKPIYDKRPVYEQHEFNKGVDITQAIRDFNKKNGTNKNYTITDISRNKDGLYDYLKTLGPVDVDSNFYSQTVIVGYTTVLVGYENVTTGWIEYRTTTETKYKCQKCSECKKSKNKVKIGSRKYKSTINHPANWKPPKKVKK